ncbi:MAG: hypothetical protein ACD_8C00133G0005 [uncultured bacterium]|nr:MAG: hypothetical protein ACD_8C00133G0005 [uncultured bacterium]
MPQKIVQEEIQEVLTYFHEELKFSIKEIRLEILSEDETISVQTSQKIKKLIEKHIEEKKLERYGIAFEKLEDSWLIRVPDLVHLLDILRIEKERMAEEKKRNITSNKIMLNLFIEELICDFESDASIDMSGIKMDGYAHYNDGTYCAVIKINSLKFPSSDKDPDVLIDILDHIVRPELPGKVEQVKQMRSKNRKALIAARKRNK